LFSKKKGGDFNGKEKEKSSKEKKGSKEKKEVSYKRR